MKTLSKAYADFARLTGDPSFLSSPDCSFQRACRLVGVAPADLDELLREELGFDGPSLLHALRMQ